VGRKSVAVVRPTFLFGSNDYMEVADNDLLDFGASDSFTVISAIRQWGTVPNDSRIMMKWSNAGGIQSGWYLTNGNPSTNQLMAVNGVSAGTASAINTSATAGTVNTMIGVRNTATDQVILYVNGVAGTPLTDSTVGTLANPGPMTIGRQDIGTGSYADMEFFGGAVFRKALTATEIALINTHYQGTETPESIVLLSTAVFWIDPARSSQEMAINRATTGKKAVAVTRPTWLLSSTYMELPDNDLIDFGSSQDFTMLVVTRVWNTPASYSYYIAKQIPNLPTGNKGYDIRNNIWPSVGGAIGDGTGASNYNTFPLATATANPSSLMTLGMQRTGTSTKAFYNNTFGTPITNSYDMSNSGVLRIAGSLDAELLAVAIFRRALTATEIAAINTYYGTV